jgi:uncharacterized LabA/DUF88 family protein
VRVSVYIDGFNLYHGLHQAHGRKFLWLDLEALAVSLLKPGQQLEVVRYFTAPVRDDARKLRRQQKFWSALEAHTARVVIERGRFQEKTMRCHGCGISWRSYEEKESDVSLAVSLVEDAACDAFDSALIVSADSDLCPAVRSARRVHPRNPRIIAAFPPKRWSDELRGTVDAAFTIGAAKFRQSLLPDPVVATDGKVYPKPVRWS